MVVSALVGDMSGAVLDRIDASFQNISWVLNGVGQATATVPYRNIAQYAALLQFGNTILLQFDNGLPDWGGIIDTPRAWPGGTINFTAYGAERLLALRQTGPNDVFRGVSAGQIFRQLLEGANSAAPTGLTIESVWLGGEVFSPDYHYNDLATVAKELTETGGEFYVLPALENGRITFTLHFAERRGTEKSGVMLVDGRNVTEASLEEQGTIANLWHVVGNGNTWGSSRPMVDVQDAGSIADYRRRERSQIISDVHSTAELTAVGDELLAASKEPTRTVTLSVIDTPPALFADYHVGDALIADVPRLGFAGFRSLVRVVGREYLPLSGVCNLVVEESV